ncbi:MAG: class I SAM-dependent methyltransferase [Candidatus Obscuribacterales bacterium]|nr:class I SAM-dependent methyltransferase [Candidatus Obscuribacterales bacterium]
MHKLLLSLTLFLCLCFLQPAQAKQAQKPLTAQEYASELKQFWDKAYSKKGYFIGTEPDDFFVDELSKLRRGKLLLPGEGEGRNAVYAASHGWYVDAFDFSVKGREKAIALAKSNGVTFNYWIADFAEPRTPKNFYDVIAIIDLPTLPSIRHKGFAVVRESLKPGGLIIYEGYVPRPGEIFWASRDELKNEFAGYKFTTLSTHNAIRFHEGKNHIDLVVQMVAQK